MRRTAWFLMLLLLGIMLTSCFLNKEDITVNRYAMIYSVDYSIPDGLNDLDNTVYDGIDMETTFQSLGFTGEHKQNSTRAEILEDINARADLEVTSEDDVTLFYFSGHGSTDGELSYLYPYLSGGTPGAISSTELMAALAEVPGQKVIILDICNSGGFVPDTGYDVDGLPESYTGAVFPAAFFQSWDRFFSQEDIASMYPSIHVISAAGMDELSYESDSIRNGYYTYYLLKALGYAHGSNTVDEDAVAADGNGDGYVTLSELYGTTFTLFTEESPVDYYYSHISGGPYDPVLIDYFPD